jgi:tetratricopeptide (TPR) repeat protein
MVRAKRKIRSESASRRGRVRGRRASVSSSNGSRRRARASLRATRSSNGRRRQNGTRRRTVSTRGSVDKQRLNEKYLTGVRNYESGVRLFQKQNYERAKEVFEKLQEEAVVEVKTRAQVYLHLCEQKLSQEGLSPRTPEEYYNLGVAQLNARQIEAALENLTKANKLRPHQEHIRYALAAAHAQAGNADAALEHLTAAIGLRSNNRYQASKDADFQSLASDPRFARLIHQGVA